MPCAARWKKRRILSNTLARRCRKQKFRWRRNARKSVPPNPPRRKSSGRLEDATREMSRLNAQEQVDHERHEKLREAIATALAARHEAESRMQELQTQLDGLASEEQARTNALDGVED